MIDNPESASSEEITPPSTMPPPADNQALPARLKEYTRLLWHTCFLDQPEGGSAVFDAWALSLPLEVFNVIPSLDSPVEALTSSGTPGSELSRKRLLLGIQSNLEALGPSPQPIDFANVMGRAAPLIKELETNGQLADLAEITGLFLANKLAASASGCLPFFKVLRLRIVERLRVIQDEVLLLAYSELGKILESSDLRYSILAIAVLQDCLGLIFRGYFDEVLVMKLHLPDRIMNTINTTFFRHKNEPSLDTWRNSGIYTLLLGAITRDQTVINRLRKEVVDLLVTDSSILESGGIVGPGGLQDQITPPAELRNVPLARLFNDWAESIYRREAFEQSAETS
ncbi:MAG: hypothetical protein HQL56_11510 [Magnetococcales bacterium]|nr:hypothetical protein [Magnetococcales bacterium]